VTGGDEWSFGARIDRLLRVIAESGLTLRGSRQLLESYSNDTWLIGEVVLRICWRGDRTRLVREALIADVLPNEVPYPEVIAHGDADGVTWLATRRVAGRRLEDAWPEMDSALQRGCAEQLAAILRSLHLWAPSPELGALISARPANASNDPGVIATSDLNPLPVDRALRLAEAVAGWPNVDRDLIEIAMTQIAGLRNIDPFAEKQFTIAHADVHLANIIWDGRKVAALLDFEWARFAPPDFDLDLLARTVEYKRLLAIPAAEASLVRWLREDYPELFSHPDLLRRLRLYALTSSLREVTGWPLSKPEAAMSPDHPIRQLRRLVAQPQAFNELLTALFD
jgi:aminoglycoside phosphotransferase (APT) family kinase protein